VRGLDLTAAAQRDLAGIAAESVAVWGSKQRDLYMADLETRIGRLRDRPELGPPSKDRPDLRRLIVGRHAVFYRFDDATVQIVRILHQHMDAPHHLGRTPKS
jgi:toxin ParE1/3/4